MAQLIQEAALVAIRKKHRAILQSDMDDAVDRLTVGPKRVGVDLGHQGQCRRATTEVGVALTSHLLRRHNNAKLEICERISIEPRGQVITLTPFCLLFPRRHFCVQCSDATMPIADSVSTCISSS